MEDVTPHISFNPPNGGMGFRSMRCRASRESRVRTALVRTLQLAQVRNKAAQLLAPTILVLRQSELCGNHT